MHDAKYREAFRMLRGEILAGKYDNALRLPSENQLAQLLSPPLTTMRQPCEAIAAMAVRTLLERIGAPSLPPREISLEATLVVRESTKGQT